MADVFTKQVELPPGRAQITGQVMPPDSPLRAPISGRLCAFYQVIGTNHTWPWHDRRFYPPEGVRFWIEGGDRQLLIVVARSAPTLGPMVTEGSLQCSIAGEVVRRTIYAGESPDTDHLLEPGGLGSRPDTYLNAEERIVVAGDTLTVTGDIVEEIDGQAQSPGFRSPPTRIFLRARSLRSVNPQR
jgi:hypothetical protein